MCAEIEGCLRLTGFTVAVDIRLLRKYRIPLQELPLLRRLFLEEQRSTVTGVNLTFGEQEMEQYSTRRADDDRTKAERRIHRKAPLGKANRLK